MKKITILLLTLSFFQGTAFSQSCLPEGITFTTQNQIDSFQVNYPGCIEIEGDVTISGDNITNLDGLSVLTSIEGNLTIFDNDDLTNLTGLEGLISIGGDLRIGDSFAGGNPALNSLTGLDGLTFIGGALFIYGNEILASLTGLDAVTSIGNFIDIFFNNALTSLTGLEGITSIGDGLSIHGNNSLISLTGLNNVTSIGGFNGGCLEINDNDALTSLTGLEGLTSIGYGLSIYGNDALTSLTGLEGLTSSGDGIYINNCTLLTSLTGLDNIEANTITDLNISENTSLSDCDVQSICDYIAAPNGIVDIHDNDAGCNSQQEVEDDCANNCLPEGITFSTQAQIDSFQINYPYCTEIQGDVIISGDSITNLNGLSMLTYIGGYLQVIDDHTLTSLSGLDNVTSIGGILSISSNAALTSLTGLEGLTSIGGDIWIFGNALTSLSGLDNVTSIGGGLEILFNHSLTSLTGLDNLISIGGDLSIGSWYWGGNAALTSLTGLDNLTSIEGDLTIYGNTSLTSLTGLDNVTFIGGGLTIEANSALSVCEAQGLCDYLMNPNGVVHISSNASGCNSVFKLGNACGNSIPCLPYGDYYFISQWDIDNFSNVFPNCTDLMGDVIIIGNGITNLNGLNEVTAMDGNLIIMDNDSLTNLGGLDNLTSIGGILSISSNAPLTSLTGLDNLTSIGGYLNIEHNSSLTSLTGLEDLTSIGGELLVGYNEALISLTGLDNVTSVGGNLWIRVNPALTSLSGIDNIEASTIAELYISNNNSLSTCEVQSICDFLAAAAPNDTILIHDNATGCNSQEEVEEACGVGIKENSLVDICAIFPNPFSGETTFSIDLKEPTQVNLMVMDGFGRMVATVVNESLTQGTHNITWNAEGLPSGIYLYRLTANGITANGKLVVVR